MDRTPRGYAIEFCEFDKPWRWVADPTGSWMEWPTYESAERVAVLMHSTDQVSDVRVVPIFDWDAIDAAEEHEPYAFTGERGKYQDVIHLRQIYYAVLDGLAEAGPDPDPHALAQAVCCEIEKQLGIYPNI